VLAGRTSRGGQWFDHPDAVFPRPLPPRTARAAAHRRAGDTAHAAASRMARALPIAGAAAGVVLVISAGVSAAVTGNPLAPIASVVTLLSPDQGVPASVTTVRRTLDEARAAAAQGELERARVLLLSARHSLPTVPRSAAGGLQQQISALEGQIAASGGATAPTASATATTVVAAPTATASPTYTAAATDTPLPTDQPTTTTAEPSPTDDPSASPTDTATASDNAPTAAVTTSAPSPS